jgi:hypothetical protein
MTDRKQKEALVIAMRENGKSYRDIAQELKMSAFPFSC